MKFKPGDKVEFMEGRMHEAFPNLYPPTGTVGTVISAGIDDLYYVQWPEGSTSDDDKWHEIGMFLKWVD